jgi:hypothetical protein
LSNTEVTFICPEVKDACLLHAIAKKEKIARIKKHVTRERFPKAL